MATLVELEHHVKENRDKFRGSAIFLRGDFNASSRNKMRASFLSAFVNRLDLSRVPIGHCTYHHFTGGGASDSDLDLLLYDGNKASVSRARDATESIPPASLL